MKLLSTKILPLSLVQKLARKGIEVTIHSFISTKSKQGLTIPTDYELTVITSKNGVNALLDNNIRLADFEAIYCVGDKTSKIVEEQGGKVVKVFKRLIDLAQDVAQNKAFNTVLYCCGSKKQTHLQVASQQEQGFELLELEVYQTQLMPKQMNEQYDAILFFSPSAVESYIQDNDWWGAQCFAIGKTTALALRQAQAAAITIATKQTIEGVIDTCLDYYKNKAEKAEEK